jgi:hypothetical protein
MIKKYIIFGKTKQEETRSYVQYESGENRDTIQKNTEALLDASKEVGLEVN